MSDEYRPVVGFEPFYLVNKQGDIITLRNKNGKKHHKIKTYRDKDGYLRVRLYGDKKCIWIGVHKVVAMAFLDNPNGYAMVNHKNYKRDDNRVENLEWCNAKENTQWSLQHYKGAHHISVIGIDGDGNKTLYDSLSDASRKTGVCIENICNCCKGRREKAGGYIWKYAEITEL